MELENNPTAAARVLETPELLERILFYIVHPRSGDVIEDSEQVQTLFYLQRVNRQFRNTISASSALRCAMFLDPTELQSKGIADVEFNPLFEYLNYHLDMYMLPNFQWNENGSELYRISGRNTLFCRMDAWPLSKRRDSLIDEIRELSAEIDRPGSWRSTMVTSTLEDFRIYLKVSLHWAGQEEEDRTFYANMPGECTLEALIGWILTKLQKVHEDIAAKQKTGVSRMAAHSETKVDRHTG